MAEYERVATVVPDSEDTADLLPASSAAESSAENVPAQPPKRLSLKERLKRARQPGQEPVALSEEERLQNEEDFKEELKYYTDQVVDLLRPIIITFAFTVWFVRRVFATSDISQYSPFTPYQETEDDPWSNFGGALVNALIMVGAILITTFVFVCLFYFRLTKVLYAWLALSVITTLGGLGGTVIYSVCLSYNFTVDLVSLFLFLWNFAAVGILSVMWSSPLYIQQGYLILISALLATDFTFLPEWTSWVFLAAISIYDLLAVLCPGGPLKMLVELAQSRNERIPALLYSAGMADSSPTTRGTMMVFQTSTTSTSSTTRRLLQEEKEEEEDDYTNAESFTPFVNGNAQSSFGFNSSGRDDGESVPLVEMSADGTALQTQEQAQQEADATNPPEDDEPRSVQLGLGDFIFYSVLVARAALASWLTLIACAMATLTGLCLTLLLLATYRHALPALPISIALGMIFYFSSQFFIVPYTTTLAMNGIVV